MRKREEPTDSLINRHPVRFLQNNYQVSFSEKGASTTRRQIMSSISKQDYINNIEESASTICSEIGSEGVDSVLQRYAAQCIKDLFP